MGGWDWTPLGPTLAWRRLLFSEPFIQPPTTQLSTTPSGSLTNTISLRTLFNYTAGPYFLRRRNHAHFSRLVRI